MNPATSSSDHSQFSGTPGLVENTAQIPDEERKDATIRVPQNEPLPIVTPLKPMKYILPSISEDRLAAARINYNKDPSLLPQPQHPPLIERPILYHKQYNHFQFSGPCAIVETDNKNTVADERDDGWSRRHSLVTNIQLPKMVPPPYSKPAVLPRLPPVPKPEPYGKSLPRYRGGSLPVVTEYLRQRSASYQLPPRNKHLFGSYHRPSSPARGGVNYEGNKRKLEIPAHIEEGTKQKKTRSSSIASSSEGEAWNSNQLNDWESIVSMYYTGKGTLDGKPLKFLRRGEESLGVDRKTLEKRRTLGKVYDTLGRTLFENTIGYKKSGDKRKMYQVVNRCRVVNQLLKTGAPIPKDSKILSDFIDARILDKCKGSQISTS